MNKIYSLVLKLKLEQKDFMYKKFYSNEKFELSKDYKDMIQL